MSYLYGKFFPAVPAMFNRKSRTLDVQCNKYLADYLRGEPIDGVAVWVHTGRGLFLSRKERLMILRMWREALPARSIIAGVGSRRKVNNDYDVEAYIEDTLVMAEDAKLGGADYLLAFPPTPLKDFHDGDELVVKYHKELKKINLPVIVFYLYEEAGGISYSFDVLSALLSMKHVVGIKLATLYSVVKMQDISRFVLEKFPDKILITGEDRMIGYSITRGSRSILVGLGSILPRLQKSLLESYLNGDPTFLSLMEKVDTLAEVFFKEPMEGYIERVEKALAIMGVIPENCVCDPYGPGIDREDEIKIRELLEQMGEI